MSKIKIPRGRVEVEEGLWHVEFYLNGCLFSHDDYDSTCRQGMIEFPAHRYPNGRITWKAKPCIKKKPFGPCIYCAEIDEKHPAVALGCVV